MANFLFWNLGRRINSAATVCQLVIEHSIDVLMLVECEIPQVELLQRLNPVGENGYFPAPQLVESRFRIFIRYSPDFMKQVYDEDRLTVRKLCFPGQTEILLSIVHFPSLLHLDEGDHLDEAFNVNTRIRAIEEQVGHSRTVVVGDFNMNPFAKGMTSASGFNAVMTHDVARRSSRDFNRRSHPFFFNPMWGHFNDGMNRPCGTYYHASPGASSLYWNMLDQVLFRPELASDLAADSVVIVTRTNNESLLNHLGRPSISDHLPIKFQLTL